MLVAIGYAACLNCLTICCSLRYHLLHPDYLYYRIRELQKNFKVRVVLCHIDVVRQCANQSYFEPSFSEDLYEPFEVIVFICL